ncbi:AAA family ATPase [Roseateles saccharophilus]|uniref:Twinkle protein n=1 Tax=Roseateles saccharophilus TaxID=304 RepID=A0A4R3UKY6_ROSSA|nr:AAA family ATPase [Roseateles saccharophilus]MDG0834182.1 toprim domain-containing protein [Roseateles saccharophilus]TCU91297.1 twinkle protein [Roseateles saccharophilus]
MNAAELSQKLADSADTVAEYLLPRGKRHGAEWKAGSVSGEEGQSLSVRITGAKRGVWRDFASGQGGDLLDLWCAARSLSLAEAITEAKAYLGIRDAMPVRERREYRRPLHSNATRAPGRVAAWLADRGIRAETVEAFKVGEQIRDDKTYALLPYLRDGELVNVKHRNIDEKRDMRQEAGAEPCLFGWHLIEPRQRVVAITEGEVDAMTLHQFGIPALSVNAGAGNHQWIDTDWERLERFSEILVCFDDDDPGRKGAAEVCQRLGLERCKVVRFGAKDANQWLQDGACGEDFHHALKEAKPLDPAELTRMADVMDAVKALLHPAANAHRDPCLLLGQREFDWFEFRPGELTVWTGYNGHGKSLLNNQILLGLLHQGERACVFSGEMHPAQQGKRLVKQATGLAKPSPAYIDAVGEWLSDRMWLFNVQGSATIARLLEVFAYASRRYGVRHFVIDSLMMTDVPEDGPGSMTAQKQAVQKLTDFAKRFGVHVHLIAHPRKGRDESQAPGKLDVAGSSKITDAADNVFTVWSARRDESDPETDKPDACLELQKQRNGDVQRMKLWLFFHRDSQQFCTSSHRRPTRLVDYSGETGLHLDSAGAV